MKKLSTYILLIAAFIFTSQAFAKEEILATITNDDTSELYTFVAASDDTTGGITNFFKDEYVRGTRTHRELLKSDGLNKDGVVLEKRDGHIIIALKSSNFDYQRGGTLTVDTLYNGINGQRKKYTVELAQSPEGFRIFKDNKIVTKFHILVNRKPIIGAVGVRDIIMK